jgi:lipopolysaccharide/colanic/teichoic acid biosynthesis glycosyltransferase
VEKYDIWHARRVLDVKPGITGFWQVEGRSATTFDTMVRMDLFYIQKWSIWLDLKLIFKTPFAVLAAKGAC